MSLKPDNGPSILFFSGGSAIRELSQHLISYTHNSIHLITPFDSGGSSAEIRKWFNIFAVGDLRNRLLALADRKSERGKKVLSFLSYRFQKQKDKSSLKKEFEQMLKGEHHLCKDIPFPHKKVILYYLNRLSKIMPETFDLRGASVGNLLFTSIYLENKKEIDVSIFIFSSLVCARGIVRPIVNENLHIGVRLDNKEVVLGQHMITGKEKKPLNKKINDLFIIKSLNSCEKTHVKIDTTSKDLIRSADLICFPMGSFFTSILATLMPDGVGEAIAENPNPKVFIPNTYEDPELFNYSLSEQIEKLISTLKKNREIEEEKLLNFILLDNNLAKYKEEINKIIFRKYHITPIFSSLITPESCPKIDPEKLCKVLISLTNNVSGF